MEHFTVNYRDDATDFFVVIKYDFPFLLCRRDSPRKMSIVVTRRSDFTGFLLVKTFPVLTVKACNTW